MHNQFVKKLPFGNKGIKKEINIIVLPKIKMFFLRKANSKNLKKMKTKPPKNMKTPTNPNSDIISKIRL